MERCECGIDSAADDIESEPQQKELGVAQICNSLKEIRMPEGGGGVSFYRLLLYHNCVLFSRPEKNPFDRAQDRLQRSAANPPLPALSFLADVSRASTSASSCCFAITGLLLHPPWRRAPPRTSLEFLSSSPLPMFLFFLSSSSPALLPFSVLPTSFSHYYPSYKTHSL